MSTEYTLTSQPNNITSNLLLAKVSSESGDSLLSIEPIGQYQFLYLENLTPSGEKFLNLTSIGYSFSIHSLMWSNSGTIENASLTLKTYHKDTLTCNFPINTFINPSGVKLDILYVSKEGQLSLTNDYVIDFLTIVIKPVVLFNRINVG